ncbi:MAG: methyltransferase, partial [Actinobacteria bacterium]|nr:methyltransferase [Actinomycetota bacterium]
VARANAEALGLPVDFRQGDWLAGVEESFDLIVSNPPYVAAGDPHLATYVQSLGARLVVAPVRMRDGSPRHDPHLLAAVYAGIMGL